MEDITLAKEIEQLVQKIRILKNQELINPLSKKQGFCVICKIPRLRPDPTGVTCGNLQCLLILGGDYLVAKEYLRTQTRIKTD